MRKIEKIYKTIPTTEGAGVHLKRGFSYHAYETFDPFLLFDDFSNTEALAYERGFPQHPHRGIETITYMRRGEVRHRDSLGNEGSIKAGEVQWMTAGSGILHEEMPVVAEDGIQGFQLWLNLPSKDKMTAPRYQEVKDIPVVESEGLSVRVIAGAYGEMRGAIQGTAVPAVYLDVTLSSRVSFSTPTLREDTYFIYVYEGRVGVRDDRSESWIGEGELALLTKDTVFACSGGANGAGFLLVGGTPIKEAIVPHGPIVMNTEAEVKEALEQLKNGTFIR
jgi:redox-sensitive bicupin YhaK (pirin superfamily)